MKVAFIHSGKSFLPELYAYKKHLETMGHCAVILTNALDVGDIKNDADIIFRFAGLLTKSLEIEIPEIHNYNSASTGSFPKIRNVMKSVLSTKPVGRIFLNNNVKSQFFFFDERPFIFRDMGADIAFFNSRTNEEKKYDLVYAGSISGRPGVIGCLQELSKKGVSIGLAGNASNSEYREIKTMKMVDFFGEIKPNEVPLFISKGRFGLNFCPDIYPFNIQTSTKVVEYLAAGIGIVSNKYQWIDIHSNEHGYKYLDIRKVRTSADLVFDKKFTLEVSGAMQFEWETLLLNCGFCDFITKFCDQKSKM